MNIDIPMKWIVRLHQLEEAISIEQTQRMQSKIPTYPAKKLTLREKDLMLERVNLRNEIAMYVQAQTGHLFHAHSDDNLPAAPKVSVSESDYRRIERDILAQHLPDVLQLRDE